MAARKPQVQEETAQAPALRTVIYEVRLPSGVIEQRTIQAADLALEGVRLFPGERLVPTETRFADA